MAVQGLLHLFLPRISIPGEEMPSHQMFEINDFFLHKLLLLWVKVSANLQ
jgi:hypothetical protein